MFILNHSIEAFNINSGDCIAQFALTRYQTTDIVQVSDLQQSIRASNGFGTSGI